MTAIKETAIPALCQAWNVRAAQLGIPKRGAKRSNDMEAFMQGGLVALLVAGIITQEHYSRLHFMCAIGRLEELVATESAKHDPEV